ncbi:MAG TPA: bifunctional oligoribonuclease/PAP phosphatase NrnA [Syntrophales bacterium]|nr:bifunctional oligoribonuclease/PAP phosphatase NrnA [Syntrophales bacterium]HOL59870.1 bifunctional oligoribonuclease/PAP phosphatase NrnA [Syntrophales bacterium]HPO36017.1 bifunctional oligoribonuclease/PAP phosphatase NrnA [Syntrophales bacterium]
MIDKIIEVINRCHHFLITSHVRLDGDALGSELALGLLLKELGKDATVYNEDPTPENYLFLPGASQITHTLGEIGGYEAAFVLDCSELDRVGREASRIQAVRTIVNIDHHLSNDGFCEIRLIDPQASSTGELIWRLLEAIRLRPTPEMATCLYTAILTDTGSFHYGNTTAGALVAASKLVACGAHPQWISQQIYENEPVEKMRLMARVLSSLSLEKGGKVACLTVMLKDLEETGAYHHHTEGLVDLGRRIRGVAISILFSQVEPATYKVSLRSKDEIDVEQVARTLGGGGHRNAAACRLQGDIEAVKRQVLETIDMYRVVS